MERKRCIGGLLVLILALVPLSCSDQSLGIFEKASPWQQYSNKLSKADLNDTKAGRRWMSIAAEVLESPPQVEIPFSASGAFKAKDVEALAWLLDLQKGTSVQIDLRWRPADSAEVFVDVFRRRNGFDRTFSFKSSEGEQVLEIPDDGTYIIRLQPELLAEGNFTISIVQTNTYAVFPVQGKDVRAVQSIFGDPRDGGRRSHEGVDIFAPKGTPVVAPVRGTVSSVRTGGLGGKTVWLRDNKRGHRLYFAHLDSQAVSFGASVKPGDTIGFVGNTGNAKYTPPHLHFGVYAGRAFDPYPLVDDMHLEAKEPNISAEAVFMRVNSSAANLRRGPGTIHEIHTSLARNEVLFVKAATHDWYQVQTPDKINGFVHRSLLAEVSEGEPAQDTSWVYVNPFTKPTDSIEVELAPFASVGSYNGYTMLADTNRNVYYQHP